MFNLLDLGSVTFEGPRLAAYPTHLPAELADLLLMTNGAVVLSGGLHVRGVVAEPEWHSVDDAKDGPAAFHKRYVGVEPHDVPFAQDCVGDQFLLRDGSVFKLSSETGEVEDFARSLTHFFEGVRSDPVEYLSLQPLVVFSRDGGKLRPGQLIDVFPPFCAAESRYGVSMRAISARDRLGSLADLADQLADIDDGQTVSFKLR